MANTRIDMSLYGPASNDEDDQEEEEAEAGNMEECEEEEDKDDDPCFLVATVIQWKTKRTKTQKIPEFLGEMDRLRLQCLNGIKLASVLSPKDKLENSSPKVAMKFQMLMKVMQKPLRQKYHRKPLRQEHRWKPLRQKYHWNPLRHKYHLRFHGKLKSIYTPSLLGAFFGSWWR